MDEKQEKERDCFKCGWTNPEKALYCLKCGSKLECVQETETFIPEGLVYLHITGSLYLIFSATFNTFIRESLPYLTLYISSSILGLYTAYVLHRRKSRRRIKILLSTATIVTGIAGTFRLFIVGLMLREGIRGLFGPAWIIFVITGLKLWLDRNRL